MEQMSDIRFIVFANSGIASRTAPGVYTLINLSRSRSRPPPRVTVSPSAEPRERELTSSRFFNPIRFFSDRSRYTLDR